MIKPEHIKIIAFVFLRSSSSSASFSAAQNKRNKQQYVGEYINTYIDSMAVMEVRRVDGRNVLNPNDKGRSRLCQSGCNGLRIQPRTEETGEEEPGRLLVFR